MIDVNVFKNLYFEWLSALAFPSKLERERHSAMLALLHGYRFIFDKKNHPLDENRCQDGIYLRTIFMQRMDVPQDVFSDKDISEWLMERPCSCLEMICSLANRISNDIMADYENPDTIAYWIQLMLSNLHILDSTNDNYDALQYVGYSALNFMNRDYAKNGEGGLFVLKDPKCDARTMDIWEIMSKYIMENYYNKEDNKNVY